ncbi:NAD(P)-dependent oxidoreductase [Dyadobacter sp. CY347]|uniref:NAD-dependent epimerase/dehydratase family protein n=1 Tax=Dyadobacter sp. CY347 TaxID=2909336 RepID=UPI001F42DFE5|nr:NAD(P)-dependent oxidoreductase [Dyadobacter sp. CY347]MCF2487361.1 NAD(P)-dependent oxidoreductase [Dyadobacter sp. CY347]
MAKYLITGGSGFIGTHVVQALIAANNDVLNLDSFSPKNPAHIAFWKNVDIRDRSALINAITSFQPQYVIHLAARTDLNGETLSDYKANSDGVTNLLDALDQVADLQRVIFASSMYVCKPGYSPQNDSDYLPHTVYGESKVLTEKIIKARNPAYTWLIIRPTSIWGPYFGEPYNLFFKIVLSRKYFHLGAKACKKTYGFVTNAVFQITTLVYAPSDAVNSKVFYIGDYEPYDITQWADEIAGIANIKIRTVPFFLFRSAAIFGDILKAIGIKFPMTSFRLRNMTTDNIHDLRPIQLLAPVLPVRRVDGSKETIEWLNKEERGISA